MLHRRYISRLELNEEAVPALAVFEVGEDGWDSVTTLAQAGSTSEYNDSKMTTFTPQPA